MKTSTVLLLGGAGLLAYMFLTGGASAAQGQGQGYGPGGGQGQGYGPGGGQGQRALPGGGGGMQPTGYGGGSYGMPESYGTQAANYVAQYAGGQGSYGGYSA